MKKILVSTLVVLTLLFSMVTVVSAANSVPTEPELRMHVPTMNDDGTEYIQVVTKDEPFGYFASDWIWVQLYMYYPDGSTKLVDPSDLWLTPGLEFDMIEEDGFVNLHTTKVGLSSVGYTENGVDYTVSFNLVYPYVGMYCAMPFNADTLVDPVIVKGENHVFYIVLSPDMQAEGCVMTNIYNFVDPDVYNESITNVADVELSSDGTYAKITLTDADADGYYHFQADVVDSNTNSYRGRWGRTVILENEMPRLYFCWVDENDNTKSYEINLSQPKTNWYTIPGYSMWSAFFFGTKSEIRSGAVEPLSIEELDFHTDLSAEYIEGREGYSVPSHVLEVRSLGFNTTGISYTNKGKTYSVDIISDLPEFGVYSESTVSQSAYVYPYNPFVFTDSNRTMYVLPIDKDEMTIKSFLGWNQSEAENFFDVSIASDGSYATITVKDGVIISNLSFYGDFEIAYADGRTRTEFVWFKVKYGQPLLMYRALEWDDQNECWYEPSDALFNIRVNTYAGDSCPVQFYYGTEDDYVKVGIERLSFPADVLRAYKEDGVIRLEGVGFDESGVITYTNSNGDTVTMPVTVNQPMCALYSSPVASKSTYLGHEITLGGADSPYVYLVASADYIISSIKYVRNNDTWENATNQFIIEISADRTYAKVSPNPNNMPSGGDYYEFLIINQYGGHCGWYFKLNRGDTSKLATPVNLVWHKQYDMWYYNNNLTLHTEERMGAMGFEVHGLCQNRFEVEVYSLADGYTRPVIEGNWGFSDREERTHFSVTDFIYANLPSGTYKFRIRSEGDNTLYRSSDWSALSPEYTYQKPAQQLVAPDTSKLKWMKDDWGRYIATWSLDDGKQSGAGYFEVQFYHTDEYGNKCSNNGSFDISADDYWGNDYYEAWLHDEVLEEFGAVNYYFKVRVIPADITKYRISEWSGFSPALDIRNITDVVNNKLTNLLPTTNTSTSVQDVQDALVNETADIRAAMAADLELSGGASSGTLDLIKQLENSVSDNVDQKVDAKNSAPQAIKDIAKGVTMLGATLNLADKNPESGKTPTVTLELDAPKEGIVIDEQQHNAVQFSMKLNGAIDKDDKTDAGQQLIVPVVIDMPVPAGINPDFLVILHKLWNGTIEQMWPYVYWNADSQNWYARFVVDSFSDFALLEYNFGFGVDKVNKHIGDAPFAIVASGNAEGSLVTYSSSNPEVATVDEKTGEVTVHAGGTVTITATASATEVYPETECSYTLTVTELVTVQDVLMAIDCRMNGNYNAKYDCNNDGVINLIDILSVVAKLVK